MRERAAATSFQAGAFLSFLNDFISMLWSYIGLIVWLLVSGVLLSFLGWTILTLFRQKQAWARYAAKHKMRYKPGTTFDSPSINGVVDGYTVSLFTGEHASKDGRVSRKMTAIEVKLFSVMPFGGALASGGMVDVVSSLSFREEYKADRPGWKQSNIIAADSAAAIQEYAKPERLDALIDLMNINNAWVVVLFKENLMLLRLDTPYPLDTDAKIDELIQKMIAAAKVLELRDGEDGMLKREIGKKPPQSVASAPAKPGKKGKAPVTLELEEEAPKAPPPEEPKPD